LLTLAVSIELPGSNEFVCVLSENMFALTECLAKHEGIANVKISMVHYIAFRILLIRFST